MKFNELKKIFSRKYIIRIVAGALVVGLISTGTVTYTALADKASATAETTNSIVDGDHLKVESKDLDKDETVYLIAKPDGTVSDTIVAAHLINKDGEDTIEDKASDLTDITNTNGNEKYTKDGDKLTWQAGGNDIYYQGHTTKEAPVTVKVTYTLDGNEVTPEELAGKSGHVKIRYDYTNNTSFKEKVNGQKVSTVVPFAAMTGMILNDDFTNVKVSNGRIIQNGTKTIALGYALPGVKDSLEKSGGSFDKDLSLPDSFELEADVKNFDLETQMTALVDASNMMTSDSESMGDLGKDMDKLSDASDQLKDGAGKLKDGAGKLKTGAGKLVDGSGQLTDGLSSLMDGSDSLSSGALSLSKGLKGYTSGVSQLNGGIVKLRSGLAPLKTSFPALSKELTSGDLLKQLSQLSAGVGALKKGSDQILAGYAGDGTENNPGLVNSMDKLQAGSKQVSDAAASVSDGAAALDKGISSINTVLDGAGKQFASQSDAAITQQIDQKLNGNAEVIGLLRKMQILGADEKISLDNIDTVTQKFTGAQTQVITALAATYGGDSAKATAAYYQVLDGLHQVEAARTALDSAKKQLTQTLSGESVAGSVKKLADGSKQLKDGSAKLSAGAKSVSDGVSAADQGVKKLYEGQKQLSSGIDTMNSSVGSANISESDLKGISGLSTKLDSLLSGVDALYSGSKKLVSNNPALTGGASKLSSGANALSSGASKLYNGSVKLGNGIDSLYNGAGDLSDGAADLYDGIVKFDKEGIEKLINSYNGDIKPLADHLRATIDAGESYESFSGLADGKSGAVKFLYRMDSIEAPSDKD